MQSLKHFGKSMLTHMCHMKKFIHHSLHLVEQLLLTEIKFFLADKSNDFINNLPLTKWKCQC